jgi:hypothetical protein
MDGRSEDRGYLALFIVRGQPRSLHQQGAKSSIPLSSGQLNDDTETQICAVCFPD